MKFRQANKLILKAMKERDAENIFKVYLVDRKHQLYLLANGVIKKNEIITFRDYYDRIVKENIVLDTRSTDEIVGEIMQLKFE